MTVVRAQYTDLPWTFQGGRYGGSSGHKTENMYVLHMVDAVFGEWLGTFTLKAHYVDFKRNKRVIT